MYLFDLFESWKGDVEIFNPIDGRARGTHLYFPKSLKNGSLPSALLVYCVVDYLAPCGSLNKRTDQPMALSSLRSKGAVSLRSLLLVTVVVR